MDLYKFVTLVGSVHFVDCGLDPWWGPSTLWICISLTLVRSVHFVDCGLDPWWGPSTDGSNLSVVITQESLNVSP